MTAARRVGVMGGTFDPIHCGHIDLGRAAAAALDLTRVLVLPASVPPHRAPPVASGYHRFAMAAMVVADLPSWQVSDLELRDHGASYTATTLTRLAAAGYAPFELYFVVGSDAFAEVETWKNYPGLLEQAHFVVVSRPGCPLDGLPSRLPQLAERMITRSAPPDDARTSIFLIDAPTLDVSSTAIRRRCARGLPIDALVDPRVRQHIEQHGLYRPAAPDRREDRERRT